jgi:starch phosphorylase
MESRLFELEIKPKIPERFARLEELANDLYYSWDRDVRRLFRALNNDCWERCCHSPKTFLRRVAQDRLEAAAQDQVFVENYNRVLSAYDTYMQEEISVPEKLTLENAAGLVAYFCAEYGFHESFPIYSGGLGILAGDYCKVMSDLKLPFVAVGLLYQQGYFSQTIGRNGEQIEGYLAVGPDDIPVTPAVDSAQNEVRVRVDLPGRGVEVKVWQAKAGHIRLYLLDTDLPSNSDADRGITRKLYGGDVHTRMQQEIVLGIGGVRALRALGCQPTVWHANEGHAAFLILERCREMVSQGLEFDAALEAVAAATVFTSHTPVAAGHDIYHHDLMRNYFAGFVESLKIDQGRLLSLGEDPGQPQGFNMTSLALRGSRFHNGVSRINGEVAAEMNRYVWPDIPPDENPFGYVTNGIHVPTFMGPAWVALFDMYFGRGWRNRLGDKDFWRDHIDRIPDHVYLSTHQVLKAEMLEDTRRRHMHALRRNGLTEPHIQRLTRYLDPTNTSILTIGFARRFATYKRATLLFRDLERLKHLLSDEDRPVVFIFAGKPHPHDQPGKELMRQIHELSLLPELEGKIILLEDYNLSMARALLPGVDVWLNTPRYPMEACGTSGMKAGINGVINLSVLDGWWAEAYDGENGWAINAGEGGADSELGDVQESTELLDLLEGEVVPLYYRDDSRGDSTEWIQKSRASMRSILPRFNALRMARDYVTLFYGPADRQNGIMSESQYAPARELAAWKRRIEEHWNRVSVRLASDPRCQIEYGESLVLEIDVDLDGLVDEDVVVECVLGRKEDLDGFVAESSVVLRPTDYWAGEVTRFRAEIPTTDAELGLAGQKFFQIRLYPNHSLLSHRFECGRMLLL